MTTEKQVAVEIGELPPSSPPANDVVTAAESQPQEESKSSKSRGQQQQYTIEAVGQCAEISCDDVGDEEVHQTGRRQRAMLAEEKALIAQVAEFREAAGYPHASYQEFETTICYERRGDVELGFAAVIGAVGAAVYVGYWRACEDRAVTVPWAILDVIRRLLITFGNIGCLTMMVESDLRASWRRFRKTWVYFLPIFYTSLGCSIAHHAGWSALVQHAVFLYPSVPFYLFITPYLFFRSCGRDMKTVRRKRVYALQMTFIWAICCSVGLVWSVNFLPLAIVATTDGERTRVAMMTLMAGWPLVALVTATARSVKDGPLLHFVPGLSFVSLAYLLLPRMLQAKMDTLQVQMLNSLIFGLFDFFTDMAIPFSAILGMAARRRLMQTIGPYWHTDNTGKRPPDQCNEFDSIDAPKRQSRGVTTPKGNDATADKRERRLARPTSSLSTMISFTSVDRFRTAFSRSSLRSLSTFLDVQTTFVAHHASPRILRCISDQVHVYTLAEFTTLVFTNLSHLAFDHVLHPSAQRLAERLGGMLVLIAIEATLECGLFLFLVRVTNLPLLSSEKEPTAVRRRLWGFVCALVMNWLSPISYFALLMLVAIDRDKYGRMGPHDFCPHFTLIFRRD
ncbi:unnamed protein product [Vitrella brassicaformis CCMP3155]|uniref:Uncharacterized protein n=2 Tax=Vitrella brassicaformis TaxID=1169539 RepID=A0A0G4EV15_VITBC|nr:unnamed protein product [Vitrella brassicaformis CCMP3155]|eukprot:CEM01882.1 unnamed protein product [Vitrella brassicaformis CCMP3155]